LLRLLAPLPLPGVGPVAPLRLLSLGVPVRASSGLEGAGAVVDGQWRTFAGWRPRTPTAATPQWLALDVGPGPAQVLLLWNAGNNTNYNETRYGGLGSYAIETSANSQDGADGS